MSLSRREQTTVLSRTGSRARWPRPLWRPRPLRTHRFTSLEHFWGYWTRRTVVKWIWIKIVTSFMFPEGIEQKSTQYSHLKHWTGMNIFRRKYWVNPEQRVSCWRPRCCSGSVTPPSSGVSLKTSNDPTGRNQNGAFVFHQWAESLFGDDACY